MDVIYGSGGIDKAVIMLRQYIDGKKYSIQIDNRNLYMSNEYRLLIKIL